jgi:hypothetical protein
MSATMRPEDFDLNVIWETAHNVPRINGRSLVHRMMLARFDEFGEKIATDFPGWEPLALALAAKGILDRQSRPYKGEALRQIWWKVRDDHRDLADAGIVPHSPYDLKRTGSPVKKQSKRRLEHKVAQFPDNDDEDPPPGVRMAEPARPKTTSQIDEVKRKLENAQPWAFGKRS